MPADTFEFIVRPVRETDVPAFRELRIEALRLHPVAFTADLAEAEARSDEEWADWARGRGDGAGAIMVAETADGRLAGMTGIYTPPQPKLKHGGIIWGVYVRAAYRRRRIGTALLQACLDWARDKGLKIARLSVTGGNSAAQKSYERMGFIPYGTEPDAVMYEGRYYDEVLMYRRLDNPL